MAWSYDRLWKLLIDKKLKKTNLLTLAQINTKTLSRMGKGEAVSMEALAKICTALSCRIEDIVEFIPVENEKAPPG